MKHLADAMSRRDFFGTIKDGVLLSFLSGIPIQMKEEAVLNDVFLIKNIPDQPFTKGLTDNHHAGVESLLSLMGSQGLKFYRSSKDSALGGPQGLIGPEDVVLVKVNAQWKYRGATNSDLVRGLVQRILEHPDTFTGEVVIFDNGQGRGSLNCDTRSNYTDYSVHANANDESHSFLYLVNTIFKDPRVSAYLLDPIRSTFIGDSDHGRDGYRRYENVSYPCFTTAGGRRVELLGGVWRDGEYRKNLKMINVPVLKHHDTGGSEITASLKHLYGVVSMEDGQSGFRHYTGLGETCGKMMASVCKPVLNILDAVWVSYSSLTGYPANTTSRINQIMAGQDPVALDYLAAKTILYPINNNLRHHPDYAGIDTWLRQARDTINGAGGLRDLEKGIVVGQVTKNEAEMRVFSSDGDSAKPVYPPLNFSGRKILNRSLFRNEYIVELKWQSNPDNEGAAGYRVYRQATEGRVLLASVDASTYRYWHRNVLKDKAYVYALTTISSEGRESGPALLTL